MLTEIVKFLSEPSLVRDGISWGLLALIILSIFVDVSKIPVNPWKHVIKGISSIFNQELVENQKELGTKVDKLGENFQRKHDALSGHVKEIEENQLEGQKRAVRRRIITFADECRRGEPHSQQEFTAIFDDVTEYNRLCQATGDKNHVVTEHVAYIEQVFQERLSKNDFI